MKYILVDRQVFERLIHFSNLLYVLAGDPSEELKELVKKIDEYEIKLAAGADADLVELIPSGEISPLCPSNRGWI